MAAAAAEEAAAAATAEEAATVDSGLCIVYSPMTVCSASYKTCMQCDAHMFSDLLRVRLPKERRCTGIIMPPTTNVCRTTCSGTAVVPTTIASLLVPRATAGMHVQQHIFVLSPPLHSLIVPHVFGLEVDAKDVQHGRGRL